MNLVVLIKGPFLKSTAVVMGKETQKEYLEYGKRFVYVFAESKHMTPKRNGSKRFRYFSINDAIYSTFSLRLGSVRSHFHPKTFCVNSC